MSEPATDLSQDPAEIRKCAARLRSRAIHQMETAQALDGAADELPLGFPWAASL